MSLKNKKFNLRIKTYQDKNYFDYFFLSLSVHLIYLFINIFILFMKFITAIYHYDVYYFSLTNLFWMLNNLLNVFKILGKYNYKYINFICVSYIKYKLIDPIIKNWIKMIIELEYIFIISICIFSFYLGYKYSSDLLK